MKKLILALVMFITISCRKDMVCSCESKTDSTAPSGSTTTINTNITTLHNVTKSEGRVNCLSRKYSVSYYTILGDSLADTEVTCSLN